MESRQGHLATSAVSEKLLHAVDALNSWVRSDSARWFSSRHPRYAIYDYKTEVIRRAIVNGECTYRWIYLTLHCRTCGGTGIFKHESGDTSTCRKCWRTGKNTLHFLETDIQGVKWHTPQDRAWRLKVGGGRELDNLSTDWEPNAKGKDLTVGEVARYLMVCEDELGEGCLSAHGIYDYGNWIDDQEHKGYKLDLGRQGAAVCEICGVTVADELKDGSWHHVSRTHADWSSYACNVCRALFATRNRWDDAQGKYAPDGGNGRSIFDEFKPPTVTDPDVREWLSRRKVIL